MIMRVIRIFRFFLRDDYFRKPLYTSSTNKSCAVKLMVFFLIKKISTRTWQNHSYREPVIRRDWLSVHSIGDDDFIQGIHCAMKRNA